MMLFVPIALQAMDERLEQINTIKKSQDYLSAEATMKTPEDAAKLAYKLLQHEIDSWTTENEALAEKSIEAERVADTIMVRRANMYRVVAYVKKGELLADQQPRVQPKPEPDRQVQHCPSRQYPAFPGPV